MLEREGIPIDCLAGTSMGGAIATGQVAAMETLRSVRRIIGTKIQQ